MTFKTTAGEYVFDEKALRAMGKEGLGELIFSVERQDSKTGVKSKTLLKINLKTALGSGKAVKLGGGTLMMSLPYQLGKGEKPSEIQLYLQNQGAKPIRIKDLKYNSVLKVIIFTVK